MSNTPSDAPRRNRASRASGPLLIQPARAAAAYNRVLPRLIALAADEVRVHEIEVPAAVSAALAALPRLRELRGAIAAQLPAHPAECIDELEDLALAAWFAHTREAVTADSAPTLEDLAARAQVLRDDLLVAAEPLARRGLLDAERVRRVRANTPPDGLAEDLLTLFDLFMWNWGEVHNKTAVTQAEIAEAGDLAQRMIVAQGRRQEAAAPAEVTDFRARALTLFVRAHDECARAVTYLRWHDGDAAEIVPPLPSRRPRARRSRVAEDAARATSPTPPADAASRPVDASPGSATASPTQPDDAVVAAAASPSSVATPAPATAPLEAGAAPPAAAPPEAVAAPPAAVRETTPEPAP